MRRGQSALERSELEILDREFETATRLAKDNPEIRFWHAIALLTAGKIEQGIALLREVAAGDRNWITLALRLPAFMLPPNTAIIDRIRALG